MKKTESPPYSLLKRRVKKALPKSEGLSRLRNQHNPEGYGNDGKRMAHHGKTSAGSRIFSHALGEYDGIEPRGHSGHKEHRGENRIQPTQAANAVDHGGNENQTEQHYHVSRFILQYLFYGEGGKGKTRKKHGKRANASTRRGEGGMNKGGQRNLDQTEYKAQKDRTRHGIESTLEAFSVARKLDISYGISINRKRNTEDH